MHFLLVSPRVRLFFNISFHISRSCGQPRGHKTFCRLGFPWEAAHSLFRSPLSRSLCSLLTWPVLHCHRCACPLWSWFYVVLLSSVQGEHNYFSVPWSVELIKHGREPPASSLGRSVRALARDGKSVSVCTGAGIRNWFYSVGRLLLSLGFI